MSKIHLLNLTSIYYATMVIAGIVVLLSGYFLIVNIPILVRVPTMPKESAVTPQEQTLNKVIDLIDNQVLQDPDNTLSVKVATTSSATSSSNIIKN
jgi:hypothetical protein